MILNVNKNNIHVGANDAERKKLIKTQLISDRFIYLFILQLPKP